MEYSFSPLLGIVIAALLGGAVGIQRQAAAKPAGFRTHLLVATAAAGFTAMGAHLHDTRIPSYIVVGIGFLGAGAIVRHGTSSYGLTTAASIWMVAAIGLVLGYANSFGLYTGLTLTAITLVVLVLSDADIMRLFRFRQKATLRVTTVSPGNADRQIRQLLVEMKARMESSDIVSVTSADSVETAEIVYLVALQRDADLSSVVREIGALSLIRKVECSEPFYGA